MSKCSLNNDAFVIKWIGTLDSQKAAQEARVVAVVRRQLAERGIHREVAATEDLREAGLSSFDMVTLVLSLEAEFDLTIPETEITPTNFRTIEAIGMLMTTLSNHP